MSVRALNKLRKVSKEMYKERGTRGRGNGRTEEMENET